MRTLSAVVLLALTLTACKDGLVEPERFGSLEGQVVDFETGAAVQNAGIVTSPATDAITTDSEGNFSIEDVLVGTYTITASRSGFTPNTVTVSIRDGRTARATLFLRQEDDDATPSQRFQATVLGFTNRGFTADSSFVTVEYQASNEGTADLAEYEVYFRIDTDQGSFFQEVEGQNLAAGARDIGTFRKQILGARAQAVRIDGTLPASPPESGT